jgi:hypothetical protein
MRKYLLDKNILSQIIKQPQSAVAEKITNLERGESVHNFELIYDRHAPIPRTWH